MSAFTFCCDKLCSAECCEPLRYGMNRAKYDNTRLFSQSRPDLFGQSCRPSVMVRRYDFVLEERNDTAYSYRIGALRVEAFVAVHDPKTFAELMAMALRARGMANVCAHHFLGHEWVVATMCVGIYGATLVSMRDMRQARKALLAVMATPAEESSFEEVRRIVATERSSHVHP